MAGEADGTRAADVVIKAWAACPGGISWRASSLSGARLGGDGGHGDASDNEGLRCRREPLEDVEMDVARVLADFSQMAYLDREGHGGAEGSGSGRGRKEEDLRRTEDLETMSKKRTAGNLAAGAVVGTGPEEPGGTWTSTLSSPRHQQAREAEGDQHKDAGKCGAEGKIDSRSCSVVCKPLGRCSHGRGKPTLSEAEKEAKRLRRVLANRVSARQTILRRKALCVELTKKAAELSQENEKMNMERVEFMKEYSSLRHRNMQLREQMAKTIECEIRDNDPSRTSSSQTVSPAFSPLMHGMPPFPQFPWPPIAKPSDPGNTGSQCASICQEQGIPSLPRPSLLLPQCPWFCPPPCQPSLHSVCSTGRDGGEDPRRGDMAFSSRRLGYAEGQSSSKSVDSTERTVVATIDTKLLKPSPTGAAQALAAQSSVGCCVAFPTRPTDVGNEPGAARRATLPVMPQVEQQHPRGKVMDTTAAAEARRRRKELTKLRRLSTVGEAVLDEL